MYVAQYPTPGSLFAEEVILDEFCFASEFHPHRNILVTGMVSGKLCAFEFSQEKYTPLTPLLLHTTAIRSLRFNAAGTILCTGSTDKTTRLLDVETQQTIWKSLRKVHHGPVNSVHILADTHQIATGDDTGLVNVFDMRSGSLISSFDEHGDFITGLTYVASRSRLVSSSGDGTIGVYDVRKGKLIGLPTIPSKSDEMMCIDKFHYGTRVICGTSKGHLISWDVGSADVFDHYHKLRGNVREISTLLIVPAHANDSYCANQQLDIALFGARDGIIRSLVVKPNEERFLTILGEVNAGGVESLSFCPRTGVVAAISSDAIRFLDGTLFQNGDALDECVRSKMTEDEVVVGGTEKL